MTWPGLEPITYVMRGGHTDYLAVSTWCHCSNLKCWVLFFFLITFCSVFISVKRKSSRRGKKKPQDSALNLEKGEYVLHYKDIIGAKIKRERRASQKPGQGVCLGVAVFLYEWKEPNKLRDQVLLFGHPSEEICIEWVKRIQNILAGTYIRYHIAV